MIDRPRPDTESGDIAAMRPYWSLVSDMLGGEPAMQAAGERHLPRFPNETDEDYKLRLQMAKFSNVLGDIVETLSAKPFSDEITVKDAGSTINALIEDIDGQGNHLHVFGAGVFQAGVADAITWILVDHTRGAGPGATVAQERAAGSRPYWVHIPAVRMIAVYSEMIAGRETIVHVRFREDIVERQGFAEVVRKRVRVLDRVLTRGADGSAISAATPTWELWEERRGSVGIAEWAMVDSAALTIDEIPLVPFVTGRRIGSSWRIRPPLADAAYLQRHHYRQESALDYAKIMTAFPMLSASGVEPPVGKDGAAVPIPVGPKVVLYAPPAPDMQPGEWKFIEPSATSLRFLADEVKRTEEQLRELGRQPLTAQSGNITTVTAAFAGDKALTVVEAWTVNFKDALESALQFTAMWLRQDVQPEVSINTDWSLGLMENDGADSLLKAREKGDLSQQTLWEELKRRSILGPNFDADQERERLLDEAPPDMTDDEAAAALAGQRGSPPTI